MNIVSMIKYILRSGHKSEQGYSDKEKTIEIINNTRKVNEVKFK